MYYGVYLLGITLSLINGKSKIFFMIFATVLAGLAFYRYGVGPDYFAYEYLYNRLNESPVKEFLYGVDNQEILFRFFGSVLKSLGISYQQYLSVIAIINLYYIGKICTKYSGNPTLSLLIYFCFYYFVWTFSGLRQGLTLAIGIYYLLECLDNNKTVKLFIVTILLSFIHTSAIVLVPLYFISRVNFAKRTLIYLVLASILISILPMGQLINHLNWIPFIDRIIPYSTFTNSINNILDFQSIIRIIFLVIAFFYYDAYSQKSEFSKRVINIYIISYCLYFFLKFSELTAARVALYGGILNIILLVNFYYLYKDKINKLIYIGCLVSLSVIYLNKELKTLEERTGLDHADSFLIPYTNIFHKNEYNFNNRYKTYLE
ncbi:EpsG family protein [Lysinibacillus sp. NPDC097287]|uniref:EpsG family protein n=1 Tax=Lysinibacillus sp. NPDC097287 TaxID=3364144 RepID=UPI003804452E